MRDRCHGALNAPFSFWVRWVTYRDPSYGVSVCLPGQRVGLTGLVSPYGGRKSSVRLEGQGERCGAFRTALDRSGRKPRTARAFQQYDSAKIRTSLSGDHSFFGVELGEDGLGAIAPVADRPNHQGSSTHDVSHGVNVFQFGLAGGEGSLDGAPARDL